MKKTIRLQTCALAAFLCLNAAVSTVSAAASKEGEYGEQAGPGKDGKESSTGRITVSGIAAEQGITVTAYQLIDGYYKDGKLVRYVLTDPQHTGSSFSRRFADGSKNQSVDINELVTPSDLSAIADAIEAGTFADQGTEMSPDQAGTTYTAVVEPGLYAVLVTGSADHVYNPALVALNITDANNPSQQNPGAVDMTDFFCYADSSTPSQAYVKSSSSVMDKTIPGSNAVLEDGKTRTYYGDVFARGQKIEFRIDGMTMPSYSDDYTDPQYVITDHLAEGLEKPVNIKVFVNGREEQPGSSTYSLTTDDRNGSGFTVSFTSAAIRSHRSDTKRPEIVITYESSLNDKAGENFSENLNHAVIRYSRNPNKPFDPASPDTYYELNRYTYGYTFAMGDLLDGQSVFTPENSRTRTSEDSSFYLVTDTGEPTGVTRKDDTAVGTKMIAGKDGENLGLKGAVFGLYATDQEMDQDLTGEKAVQSSETDEYGHLHFHGLDDNTFYYIKEIKAPEGYCLNEDEYLVKFSAWFTPEGVMAGYRETIWRSAGHHEPGALDHPVPGENVEEAATLTYTAHPKTDETGKQVSLVTDDGSAVYGTIEENGSPVQITNIKIQKLPSTGGTGLVIPLVAALILITSGMTVRKRRNEPSCRH
ncbi:MAG: isopeptide-forming domain-containing fimbrial protein [Eubacteriales bacterium]|jgi:fimbrial isopeptide formation D2 family protein/LPXTG-motif cell wall-anchored protein